ncbi:MAG: hypothetical protein JWP85_2084 [Rhodoglobus sp.]|nr:hypothetical protein [Rhodoglobus sp.]
MTAGERGLRRPIPGHVAVIGTLIGLVAIAVGLFGGA